MVRLAGSLSFPAHLTVPAPTRPSRLHFCARFDDLDAAMMHFHSAMPRRLVDLDRRLYRVSVLEAVAAADAILLPHRRVYLDPDLADEPVLAQAIARRRARHLLWTHVFDGVGYVALLLLLGLTLLLR